jgi:hypothetical protein
MDSGQQRRRNAYRIEKIHGLIFMDGEEAPLARRYSLQKKQVSRRFVRSTRVENGLTRAKEPAFLREVSIAGVNYSWRL